MILSLWGFKMGPTPRLSTQHRSHPGLSWVPHVVRSQPGPWKVVTTEVRSAYRKLKNWQSTENLLFTVSRKRTNPPQAFGLFWPFSEKLVKPRSASSAGLPQGFTSLQYSVQYWAKISRFPENQEIRQTLCLQRLVGDIGGTLCTSDIRLMRPTNAFVMVYYLLLPSTMECVIVRVPA